MVQTEWKLMKLEDVCVIEIGKTPLRSNKSFWDINKSTNNIWLSIADLKNTSNHYVFDSKEYISDNAKKNLNLVKKGTLLVSFKLTLGRLAFAGRDLYTNEAIASLVIKSNKILNEYLFYYLSFFDWDKETKGDVKVKGKTLNKQKLKQIDIFVPSISEQKEIVKILDTAFEKIAKAKENAEINLKNSKEIFESYLNDIFENKGKDWEEKKLGDLGLIQTGTTPPTKDKLNYGDYIDFVKPSHFLKNGTINTNKEMLSKKGLEKGRFIKGKSVLMVCIGATIGKTAYSVTPISMNQQINSITPFEKYNYKFLYYEFISNYIQNQILLEGNSAKTTLPIINKSKWMKIKVKYPKIKDEQEKIVYKLDQLSEQTKKLEKIYTKKLQSLEELKNSILEKAFKGELTKDIYE
jgi:type I restriction enzyme S subunit